MFPPLGFLIYFFVIYIRWSMSAEPGESFSKDYWYTERNPLYRTWWPTVVILGYMALVVVFGMTA